MLNISVEQRNERRIEDFRNLLAEVVEIKEGIDW